MVFGVEVQVDFEVKESAYAEGFQFAAFRGFAALRFDRDRARSYVLRDDYRGTSARLWRSSRRAGPGWRTDRRGCCRARRCAANRNENPGGRVSCRAQRSRFWPFRSRIRRRRKLSCRFARSIRSVAARRQRQGEAGRKNACRLRRRHVNDGVAFSHPGVAGLGSAQILRCQFRCRSGECEICLYRGRRARLRLRRGRAGEKVWRGRWVARIAAEMTRMAARARRKFARSPFRHSVHDLGRGGNAVLPLVKVFSCWQGAPCAKKVLGAMPVKRSNGGSASTRSTTRGGSSSASTR